MFIINSKLGNLTLTLVFYVTLFLALSVCSDAKGLHLQHRDHASLQRLIKKRAPPPPLVPVIGAGAAVPVSPSSSSASTTTATTSTTSSATQSTTSGTTSGTETTTSSSTSSSSTTISSSTSSSQSSTSTPATSSTTSSTSASQPLSILSPTPVSAPPKSTVTQVESVDPTSTPSSTPSTQSGTSTTKSTTLTVVIIVASCVAGVAILWTVFRKWKLGRSSKFDERLQPIDWHPTGTEDGGQRRFSTGASSAGSHGGVTGGYSGSDHGHGGSDHVYSHGLPDHDFTAGPATLAPVGGYADLARGSSPQPSMHQVTRGSSMSRPTYDVGVPLHHQGGYSAQDAYSGLKV